MLNGRKRALIVVIGSMIALVLGFLVFVLFYGIPRWGDAIVSALYLLPIPVLVLLYSTRSRRK
ncbi:hypothetical protein FBY33_3005 [Arthrobacter sp. SLBN-112]|jgi:biotin transporter BioY|nr:hypothetical protein FBY33_3005 [Arthrobacter sp. SLBN-112]